MYFLYEDGDVLNRPVECFYFDTDSKYFPVHAHWHFYMELVLMLSGNVVMSSGSENSRCTRVRWCCSTPRRCTP